MTTPGTHRPLLIMDSSYAAATRVQLEAMGRVLEPYADPAAEILDEKVLRLISLVAQAVQAAEEIEQSRRPQLTGLQRRGVRLVKY